MGQAKIEHVVVLMLENRSYDHMLGLLPNRQLNGVLGADGATVDPALTNTVSGRGPGKTARFAVQTGATYTIDPEQIDTRGFGGPGHSFPDATQQLYNAALAPQPPGVAPLSGFAQNYFEQLRQDVGLKKPTDAQISVPLQVFKPGQLPTLWQLAQEFCVCDRWFSEVPGPTQPNRLYVHSATSSGFTHNVWQQSFSNRTVYEELDKAGRDWGVFYFDLRDTDSFVQIKKRVDRIQPFASFIAQAGAGTLPAYSFLCPRFNEPPVATEPPPNSEHAPYDVRNGENLIADVYEALRAGPDWEQTLLVITYDEHGGYYDHVPPPATGVANPDGLDSPTDADRQHAKSSPKQNGYLLKPDYRFDFRRLGLRVPTVLISPWIAAGSACQRPLQHTSILATLRDLYEIGTLTHRDAQAASFAAVLSLDAARTDAPLKLNRPPAAASGSQARLAPLTQQQSDMWPLLSQLDGHRDSGKVVAEPATRGEAARYIAARIAAHNRFHRARRRKATYAVTRAADGGYSWILHDERGKPIAASVHSYRTRAACEAGIAKVRDLGPFARQSEAAAHPA